ncbi:MAG: sporulation histidine kinase inhibitor Sda [Bacillota bacterium]
MIDFISLLKKEIERRNLF